MYTGRIIGACDEFNASLGKDSTVQALQCLAYKFLSPGNRFLILKNGEEFREFVCRPARDILGRTIYKWVRVI